MSVIEPVSNINNLKFYIYGNNQVLNNSVFSSPNSFSKSGEDISLILLIFIISTYLFSFSSNEFCFIREFSQSKS